MGIQIWLDSHLPAVVAMLTILAVFCGICALAWSWLAPSPHADRLRRALRKGSAATVQKKRQKAEPERKTVAQAKPSRLLQKFVDVFKAGGKEDDKLVLMLSNAGYRGRAAVVKYLAARIVTPIVATGLTAAYVFLLATLHQPAIIKVLIVCAGGAVGYFLPGLFIKARISARQKEIGRAWPDAVDLLLICVETGMSIEHGFRKVAEEMAGNSLELAKELSLTTAELAYQQERRTAYENLARRTALEPVKAVTTCLIQSEKYGTSLGMSLRVLAQESRDMRMAAAEKKAAALPPKLTVPMIIFFLPVLFAVIITPAVIQVSG